jgi:hypothetical protein
MIKYYATFRGNDTFQTTHPIVAKDFPDAVRQAERVAVHLAGQTIEQLRIAAIEEQDMYTLDH